MVIQGLSSLPIATFIVTGMAIGVSILFAVGRRLLTNVEKTKRIQAEIKAFHSELRQAVLSKNAKQEEKLRRKEKQIREMQAKVSMESLKVSGLFMIPLLIVWWGISGLIGTETVVAISPVPIPIIFLTIEPGLTLWWWYIISSFAFSGIITKAFGVSMS